MNEHCWRASDDQQSVDFVSRNSLGCYHRSRRYSLHERSLQHRATSSAILGGSRRRAPISKPCMTLSNNEWINSDHDSQSIKSITLRETIACVMPTTLLRQARENLDLPALAGASKLLIKWTHPDGPAMSMGIGPRGLISWPPGTPTGTASHVSKSPLKMHS